MKLTESKLRDIVREELSKVLSEQKPSSEEEKVREAVRQELRKMQLNEGEAFKPAKMRELVDRRPHLQQIAQSEGLDLSDNQDLKALYDREVRRNKRMKRKYRQASPQPQGG